MVVHSKDCDGLVDSLGQCLTPAPVGQGSPVQVTGGTWAFQYSPTDPKRLVMNVTVQLTMGMSLTVELSSVLCEKPDVRQLQKWLNDLFGPPDD